VPVQPHPPVQLAFELELCIIALIRGISNKFSVGLYTMKWATTEYAGLSAIKHNNKKSEWLDIPFLFVCVLLNAAGTSHIVDNTPGCRNSREVLATKEVNTEGTKALRSLTVF